MSVPGPAADEAPEAPGALERTRAGLRRLGGLVGAVVGRVQRHGQTGRAGQFAYNAFIATIPFLFIAVSLIGIVGSPSTYDELIDDTGDAIPAEVAGFLRTALREASSNTEQATLFLVIGVVAGLWATANVVGTLGAAFDAAYEVDGRPWVWGKLAQLGFAAVASVLAVAAAIVMVGGPRIVDAAIEEAGASGALVDLVREAVSVLGVLLFAGVLLVLYRFLPNVPGLRVRGVLAGTAVATAGWFAATRLFRLYVDGFGSYNKVYGSLGAVVVYLVFLYLTGLVLMIGGEVNAELRARRRARQATAG